MVNAGIVDNDYVLVLQQGGDTLGDIVVALVDNENTVKRYMKDKRTSLFEAGE